jgi:hypothetical protein
MGKPVFDDFPDIVEHGLIYDPLHKTFHRIIQYKANGKVEISGLTIYAEELERQELEKLKEKIAGEK